VTWAVRTADEAGTHGQPAVPSHADPTAWRASRGIGGAWGRHAGVGGWWSPLRWVLAMTMAVLILGFAEKSPCADGDWTGVRNYSHVCDSQIVPLWTGAQLDSGAMPYRDTTLDLPIVTGGFVTLSAEFTRGLHALQSDWSSVVLFVVVTSLLLAICALVVAACTALTARRRPYDAALFALSPLLFLHAFTAWDLLAMAFTSGALLAWTRRRPVLAGTLVGLGAAAKLYPALLLVAIWILAIRTRKFAEAVWATATAVAIWLAVNLPIAFAYHSSWWDYYRTSIHAPAERSTLWAVTKTIVSGSVADKDATAWTPPAAAVALAVTGALLLVAFVGLRAPSRPRLAQLAFLCVLAYLITSKQWSPSESLWLLPLLALARPRWRLTLLWQFSEALVWIGTMLVGIGTHPEASNNSLGAPYGWLVLFLIVRDIALVALGALVVQEIWHPELDVVRVDGEDDPSGGVFEGAPDYWTVEENDAYESDLRK